MEQQQQAALTPSEVAAIRNLFAEGVVEAGPSTIDGYARIDGQPMGSRSLYRRAVA